MRVPGAAGDDRVPVLWLCGPPGAGKTAVAWEIFVRLTLSGIHTAYVDIDQLGICYPDVASDPGRYRLKAQNLATVVANFRMSGARVVVVSGVVDAAKGVDEMPGATLTVCRLRAGTDELRARLIRRGALYELDTIVAEADAMDRTDFADVCIDTEGRSVAAVTRQVRERTVGWPRLAEPTRGGPPRPTHQIGARAGRVTVSGPVLWLCGATGVGKSVVGWQVYMTVLGAGVRAAFIDLDQIGFCRPAPTDDPRYHRLKARNVAAMWRAYRASGSECLVVVGPVDSADTVSVYGEALPANAVTLCRLHAGRDELTQRIMLRGRGGGPGIPGDWLKGLPEGWLLRVADRAVAEAEALERASVGDLRIDTDGRSVEEVARAVAAAAGGWPRLPQRFRSNSWSAIGRGQRRWTSACRGRHADVASD